MSDIAALRVLYRDDCLLAVTKPSGMVVHRGWATDRRTAYDIVRDDIVGAPVFALHRLDRGTSGVLLFALDAQTAKHFQEQLSQGLVNKQYLGLVRGVMRDRIFLNHPVKQPEGGRVEAITEFFPVGQSNRWSLVEAFPITGRSHQIRLHLKHLSHPLVGDVKYGKGDVNRIFRDQYSFARLALHAFCISFEHPQRGQMSIEAPLEDDFSQVLKALELKPVTALGREQGPSKKILAMSNFVHRDGWRV